MSVELILKAIQAKVGNAGQKLVLIKLADHANEAGMCWPSYQHVADHVAMGRSTVKAHIKALAQANWIRVLSRGDGKSSNLYELLPDNWPLTGFNSDPVGIELGQEPEVAHKQRIATQSDFDPPRSDCDPSRSDFSPPRSENDSTPGQNLTPESSQITYQESTTTNNVFAREAALDRSGRRDMVEQWQPEPVTLQRLQRLGIPVAFAQQCIEEFRIFWLTEGRKPHFGKSWDGAFIKTVQRRWVEETLRQAQAESAPSWSVFDFDFSAWCFGPLADDITTELLQAWLENCRLKKKIITQMQIEYLGEQLHAAYQATGEPVALLLEEVVTNGWAAFKAQWLIDRVMQSQQRLTAAPLSYSEPGHESRVGSR